ncbi:hypothetical protein [Clostridium sp.]|uniref:hypothetical protein n=1 Tax=Clostridium sp. TaxID=1506 RepID=UPI0032164204
MSRSKKVVRNIIILTILLFLLFMRSGLHLTPIAANEQSERSKHYGPSEVVHVENFEKVKYILCKYDKWVSCSTVNKELFFFWRIKNQIIEFEYDKTKAIDYTLRSMEENFSIYGIVNDDKVKKIEVTSLGGEVFTQTEFYDDLFLLIWKLDNDYDWGIKNIKGYDSDNNVIFEEKF